MTACLVCAVVLLLLAVLVLAKNVSSCVRDIRWLIKRNGVCEAHLSIMERHASGVDAALRNLRKMVNEI